MKVALITGGSRGIGAATVEKFAHNNFSVILNYFKSDSQAVALREKLLEVGCDVHLFCADVSLDCQVCSMFEFIEKYFKHLDVLVNNAGISMYKQCQDISNEEYDRLMNVNAKGQFLCCREAAKMFIRQKYGSIVNVSSIWGLKGASCESVYSMSKHAVVGLTKSLASELASCGVKVNCICPPIVKTDMCANLLKEDIDSFCFENKSKVYSPDQVAEVIFDVAISSKSGVIVEL